MGGNTAEKIDSEQNTMVQMKMINLMVYPQSCMQPIGASHSVKDK
jgi:hypothetical protein